METIKYTDQRNKEVSEDQKDKLEYFFKTYYTDEKPIRCENYKNGEFRGNTYYVISLEEITARLNVESTVSFQYTYNHKKYSIEEYLHYDSGILTSKIISVRDSHNNTICFAKYEMEDGLLKLGMIEKHYYEDGEFKYDFDYDSDGSCFLIYDVQNFQSDIFVWSIGEPHVRFTWEGFEYYRYKEPIIPEK